MKQIIQKLRNSTYPVSLDRNEANLVASILEGKSKLVNKKMVAEILRLQAIIENFKQQSI